MGEEEENPFLGLRNMVLTVSPADAGLEPTPDAPDLYGVITETAYPNGMFTLVTLVDGTTSMYLSNGGGYIGAGAHQHIAEKSKHVVGLGHSILERAEPVETYPLPTVGEVRFHLLGYDGGRSVAGPESTLAEGDHPLSRILFAAHDVIGTVREKYPDP